MLSSSSSSSSTRQPRNPFRVVTVDKNDPFANAPPLVKFCYVGAVTILLVAVATLAFTTITSNQTASSVTDAMVSYYNDKHDNNNNAEHLRTRVDVRSSTFVLNTNKEQIVVPPVISVPSISLAAQQQHQQRKEGGGVRGLARMVVSGENISNNSNNNNRRKEAPASNSEISVSDTFRSDDEEDAERIRASEDEISLDQDLIVLQQANPAGVITKILGAAKEQVQKENREAHRSEYLDFGHDKQDTAASNTQSRQQSDSLHHQKHFEIADPEHHILSAAEREQPSRDQESSSSSQRTVKVIRRKRDSPVRVLSDNPGSDAKVYDQLAASNEEMVTDDQEGAHHHKRSAVMRISVDEEVRDDERPVVDTLHERASSIASSRL